MSIQHKLYIEFQKLFETLQAIYRGKRPRVEIQELMCRGTRNHFKSVKL